MYFLDISNNQQIDSNSNSNLNLNFMETRKKCLPTSVWSKMIFGPMQLQERRAWRGGSMLPEMLIMTGTLNWPSLPGVKRIVTYRGNWREERVRERDKGKFKRRKSEGERQGEVDKERERWGEVDKERDRDEGKLMRREIEMRGSW